MWLIEQRINMVSCLDSLLKCCLNKRKALAPMVLGSQANWRLTLNSPPALVETCWYSLAIGLRTSVSESDAAPHRATNNKIKIAIRKKHITRPIVANLVSTLLTGSQNTKAWEQIWVIRHIQPHANLNRKTNRFQGQYLLFSLFYSWICLFLISPPWTYLSFIT